MTQQTGAADYLELLTETRVVVYKFPDIVLYSNSEIRILKGKTTNIHPDPETHPEFHSVLGVRAVPLRRVHLGLPSVQPGLPHTLSSKH